MIPMKHTHTDTRQKGVELGKRSYEKLRDLHEDKPLLYVVDLLKLACTQPDTRAYRALMNRVLPEATVYAAAYQSQFIRGVLEGMNTAARDSGDDMITDRVNAHFHKSVAVVI